MKLMPRDPSDYCFYNWIATDKILTGISLTNCNDDLSAHLEGLNFSYIESTSIIDIWFSANRLGDYLIVQDWDLYFIIRDDGRITLDASVWMVNPLLYLPFQTAS